MAKQIIAMIAHDARKEDILELVSLYAEQLERFDLVATRGTGSTIHERTRLPVRLVHSGAQGGDQQIGAMIAAGDISAVIFLRDPLTAHAHEPDIAAVLRVCDVCNVPVATNLGTARALLEYVLKDSADGIERQPVKSLK